MRILDALARYETQLAADGRSEHTIGQRRRHVRLLDRWLADEGLAAELEAIDHEVVARFLASPSARTRPDGGIKRSSTTNALRSSLRSFFRYTTEAGYVERDPTRLVRRARCSPPPPRTLSEGDSEKLLAVMAADTSPAGQRDHALFATMLGTGIRLSSALALDVADMDLDRRELRLRVTKNDAPGTVYLSEAIAEHLQRYVGGRRSGPLFPNRSGGRLGRRSAHRRLPFWMERAAIRGPASPHTLRHAFGLRLYARTQDLLLVQAAMHHRSISSTTVYARASQERLREVMG